MISSGMNYRVSVFQYHPRLLDVDANLRRAAVMLETVETDLIVLPELCLTGYVFSSAQEVESVSESLPEGRCFDVLRELAARKNFSLVYGFPERHGGRIYNSCALINPDGGHHVYRKAHLFKREKLFFSAGDDGFNVIEAKGGVQLGLMICFDWIFPEAARTLALKGAQIICHPANLVLPWCQRAMVTRSLENGVFSITANRFGEDINGDLVERFTGQSQILGTKGEILVRMGEEEEGIRTVAIDPAVALDKHATPMNHLFDDRRRELYQL